MTADKKQPSVRFILLTLAGSVLFWAILSDAWGYSALLPIRNGTYLYGYVSRIVWVIPAVCLIVRFRNALPFGGKELLSPPVLNRSFLIVLAASALIAVGGMLIRHGGFRLNPDIDPLPECIKLIIVGIVEETVFRVWGYNALTKRTTDRNALILSTLFFILVHWPSYFIKLYRFGTFDPVDFLTQSLTAAIWGAVFCLLLKKSRSVFNPMIAHTVYDVLIVLFVE